MPIFRNAFNDILHPAGISEANNCVKRWKLRWYLHEKMIKLVMLKNKYPEDWDDKCDYDFAAYSRGGKYLRTNIERYEGCVKFLVPEADDWTEEQWADEALILQCIKTR